MSPDYLSIQQIFTLIDEPNRSCCIKLFDEHKDRFEKAPGAQTKHQAWPGGYIHHLEETMNFARSLYDLMSRDRPLPFSLSDALLVLYLHDLEKPFKYVAPIMDFNSDNEEKDFLVSIAKSYNFNLTPEHLNGLTYIHGEGDEYHPTKRIQGPLAAFVHVCDVVSARIWFDYPKQKYS
jgi:hypothetical protein